MDEYSHLFESRTVLGRGSEEIVRAAWDFDRLASFQERYLRIHSSNLRRLARGKASADDLMRLAREEMEAYLYAMHYDPLLPSALWPTGYMGKTVWELHRLLIKEIRRRLQPWRTIFNRS